MALNGSRGNTKLRTCKVLSLLCSHLTISHSSKSNLKFLHFVFHRKGQGQRDERKGERVEGMKEGRKEGRQEGRKEGREEGRQERMNEGTKEQRKEEINK